MRNVFFTCLVMGLSGVLQPGNAQEPSDTLRYELTTAILEEFKLSVVAQAKIGWYERRADGKYHWCPAEPGARPVLRLTLLDRAYSQERLAKVLAGEEEDARRALTSTYFTPADLVYMRQQVPAARAFRLKQTQIRQPWAKVVPLDTLLALNKRLGKWADMLYYDSLSQRFGTHQPHSIANIVFTKDRKRALVEVVQDAEYRLCVYQKTNQGWCRQQILYWIVS